MIELEQHEVLTQIKQSISTKSLELFSVPWCETLVKIGTKETETSTAIKSRPLDTSEVDRILSGSTAGACTATGPFSDSSSPPHRARTRENREGPKTGNREISNQMF